MGKGLRLVSAGLSHVGQVRAVNEDAWIARADLGLFAVADGMGGHARGDVASRMIVEALGALPTTDDPRLLREATEAALLAVNHHLARDSGEAVSGSTVAVLLLADLHYAALWVGDSRIYQATAQGLSLLTHDHSVVQELVDAGALSHAAARDHPLANRVTRAIGAGTQLMLDGRHGPAGVGDTFVLCSDGLTRHLEDVEIGAALDRHPPAEAAAALIEATLARGARDNVTVIVVRLEKAEDDPTLEFPAGEFASEP
jgi:serine/threonine protein phosphatase PrpC